MNEQDQWIILDTETTGIRNPIYPVEIAAQIMRGWLPVGNPFHVLINFDVPIEPIAEKIHGYSRDYLRKHGIRPKDALIMFLDYAQALPIVAYNLTYDWNRVLAPTFQRIRARAKIRPGFCVLNLTRHVVPMLPNFKLKTVIKTFGIAGEQTHHADDDVRLIVQFISQYLGPHLLKSNVIGFESVAECAKGSIAVPPLELPSKFKKEKKQKIALDQEAIFSIGELVGICRTIIFDNQITADELNFLAEWLERCPRAGVKPIATMFDLVQEIVADGVVTTEEQQQLTKAIEEIIAWHP